MKEKIIKKINYLLELADKFLDSAEPSYVEVGYSQVSTTKYNPELYAELKTSSKSLILKLYGSDHPYYLDLTASLKNFSGANITKGILNAVKREIEDGFIISIHDLVSSEIFTDFIEMAEYLIKENYKDPAAVIIGSVLENRLRSLASSNDLEINNDNGAHKKANLLNNELYKSDVYGKLDQKSIVAWLDLRNQAAHGHYDEYNKNQVELMLNYVRDFINRIKL